MTTPLLQPGPLITRYAELHARSNFTFLTGASHPEELVEAAHQHGLSALAITDVNTLAGVVRAHVEAKKLGLPLIIGSEVQFQAGPRAVLLAGTRQGYANLSHLLTIGRRRAPKGECFINEDDLLLGGRHDGLFAILLPPDPRDLQHPGTHDAQGCAPISPTRLGEWREVFGDRLHLGLARHFVAGDVARTNRLAEMAAAAGVPVVAVNSVEMHTRLRKALHDVVACIREKTTLDAAGWHLLPNAEACLKPPSQMSRIFHDMPDAVARAAELAGRIVAIGFSLDQLRFEYPDEYVPPGETPAQYLRRLTAEGAARRYPPERGGTPDKVQRMVEHELALIEELRYEPYFLTIYDVVRYARSLDILCQGRGSAANSAVCFCLGITSVDPATSDMLFERFISRERNEPPDIDVDFEHERREEVIQYVYNKYGRDRAAMVCEVIRYRGRSALREVGKALGLSLDQVDRLAKLRHWHDSGPPGEQELRKAGIDLRDRRVKLTLQLAQEIAHFPRHLSIHVGGFVITRGPISDLVPVENAAMADRTVIQWDKDDAEALGLLKVDCLALGMLTAVRKCFQSVRETTGRELDMANVPPDDKPTYAMIQSADTVGVFQIESRGQMSMLVRLKPANFYDLVIEVAIMRPGPLQGGMVHPYLRRRNGLEKVDYPMPQLEPVLRRTLGVPLFQEQC
ncbi:MAG: PHP domain-containing protein, partial [Planctomycetota bacterium]